MGLSFERDNYNHISFPNGHSSPSGRLRSRQKKGEARSNGRFPGPNRSIGRSVSHGRYIVASPIPSLGLIFLALNVMRTVANGGHDPTLLRRSIRRVHSSRGSHANARNMTGRA